MSALPVNWVRHLGYFTPPWSSSWAPRDQTWSWSWSLKQTKHSCVFDFTFILGKLLFINHKLRAYHDVCVLWSNPSCSDLLRSLGLENDSLMYAAFELGFPQVRHFVPLLQNYKISSKRKEKFSMDFPSNMIFRSVEVFWFCLQNICWHQMLLFV